MDDGLLGSAVIERVRVEDANALEDLLVEIKRETVLKRGGSQLLEELGDGSDIVARMTGDAKDTLALRAVVDMYTVGVAWAAIRRDDAYDAMCVIRVLAVRAKFRKQGIGRQLFQATKYWAATEGARSIEVVALPGDRHTKNFCEQNGLVARSLVMHQFFIPPHIDRVGR